MFKKKITDVNYLIKLLKLYPKMIGDILKIYSQDYFINVVLFPTFFENSTKHYLSPMIKNN